MGNVFSAVHDVVWRLSVESDRGVEEDRLLLQEAELWRLHWSLSQDLLQSVPPRWLHDDNGCSTAKILLRRYYDDGALSWLEAVLKEIGQDDWISSHLMVGQSGPGSPLKLDPDFVTTHRRKLISRMQRLDAVLSILREHHILNTANMDAIHVYGIHKDKNRALVDLVLRKGDKAQAVLYKALSQSEPFLLQELEEDHTRDECPSDSSVLSEMLEYLVSGELRCFQWLVSDHMTGEIRPIGREQLQQADRPTTVRLLQEHFGSKKAEVEATSFLLKIVPLLSVCIHGKAVTSARSHDVTVETNMNTSVVEITPEVSEDGNMFRLRCQQPGVYRCSLTGLQLEGVGDVIYQLVPWDLDFLSSKGLRPAGPLIRFTLLTGSFHRVHLPHAQIIPDGGRHFLSVAHVTADCVDFITPGQVTDSHVIINVSGFSCFGAVASVESDVAINGLVLLFYRLSDSSLFVLLLPRNVCLSKVIKECQRRMRAEYVETISDCELIPNQTYRLSEKSNVYIQPETSKFVNFSDYNNFLPSFQVQLDAAVSRVELELSHVTPQGLIGWLFGSKGSVVWSREVHPRAAAASLRTEVCVSESADVTLQLLSVLKSLCSEDLKTFQHHLSLLPDPVPVCKLEAVDRTRTVDLMVQQYHPEGAVQVTEEILRTMNYNQLADQLHKNRST